MLGCSWGSFGIIIGHLSNADQVHVSYVSYVTYVAYVSSVAIHSRARCFEPVFISSVIGIMAAIGDIQPLADWLEGARNLEVCWHKILNSNTSTRPKHRGGKTIDSLADCYNDFQENDQFVVCYFIIPCSLERDDGWACNVSGWGESVNEARNDACKLAFAQLLRQRPDWIIFHQKHWNMTANQFQDGLQTFVGAAIRIEPASGGRTSRYEPLDDNLSGQRDELIFQVLKKFLIRVGGPAVPGGFYSTEWKALDKLTKKGSLRGFIEARPEFVIVDNSRKGWSFNWSADFSSGASSSHGASNAQATMANATSDALASGRIPSAPGFERKASVTWLGPDIVVQAIMKVKTPGYTSEGDGYISVKEGDRVIIKTLPVTADSSNRFSSYVYVGLVSGSNECLDHGRVTGTFVSVSDVEGLMPVQLLAE